MDIETPETIEETTTSDKILIVAGYVAASTILFIGTKKVLTDMNRWRISRYDKAFGEDFIVETETPSS